MKGGDLLKKLLKSKTLDFNAAVPALAGVLFAFGIEIPAEVVAGVLVVGNWILRFFTKGPISDK